MLEVSLDLDFDGPRMRKSPLSTFHLGYGFAKTSFTFAISKVKLEVVAFLLFFVLFLYKLLF